AHEHEGAGCSMPSKMPIEQDSGNEPFRRVSVSITLDCGMQPLAGAARFRSRLAVPVRGQPDRCTFAHRAHAGAAFAVGLSAPVGFAAMNAADRRRLTPSLGIGAAVLLLVLIALWLGLGRGAHWHDKAAPPKLPQAGPNLPAPTVPLLEQYAAVWQHPLFSPSRTPEAPAGNGDEATGD